MKQIIFLILFCLSLTACQQEKIPVYSGKDYVQLKDERKLSTIFSFVYSGSTKMRDTLYLDFKIIGPTKPYDRKVNLKQVKEYGFEFEYDGDGVRVDSILVEMGGQAEEDKHFVPFDDPSISNLMIIKADSTRGKIGIVLLRDISLKETDKRLNFQIVPSKDFEVGDLRGAKGLVIIVDRLTRPDGWNKDWSGESYISPDLSRWWGVYGPVKHQFMIDVSTKGEKWDAEFLKELNQDEGKMDYYMAFFTRELAKVNQDRHDNRLPSLMEDPNNPNTVITF